MEKKNEFKPYIPADKIVPEFTVTSIVIGIILAVVFGAANAYLGLIVGMTVSASIPAGFQIRIPDLELGCHPPWQVLMQQSLLWQKNFFRIH